MNTLLASNDLELYDSVGFVPHGPVFADIHCS